MFIVYRIFKSQQIKTTFRLANTVTVYNTVDCIVDPHIYSQNPSKVLRFPNNYVV